MKTLVAAGAALLLTPSIPAGELTAVTPTMAVYFENAANTTPEYQQLLFGSWTTKASAPTVSSPIDWTSIRNCPKRAELAMVTTSDDRAVRLQLWDGASWGAASTITPDCGDVYQRAFDAEYQQSSGTLLAVYRKTTSNSIYYRNYNVANPSEQTYSPGLAASPIWMRLLAKPNSDNQVLVVCTGANLYGMVWNGSAWGNFTTLETNVAPTGRPYAVARELTTGHAIVAWGVSASSTPKYAVWSGSSWSAAASMPAVNGSPGRILLASCSKTGSNDILAGVLDSSKRLSVCNWNGSAWGTMTSIETNMVNDYERRFGLAYQPDGTKALVLWHTSGATALRYRTWSGAAWSGQLIGPDLGSDLTAAHIVPGVTSADEIVCWLQHKGPANVFDYQVYSQTGIDSLSGVSVEGAVGQQVAGVTLPTPPAYAVGATDKTYGNNTTTSLAPGSYRDLTAGNAFVLSVSSGTYVFRNWTAGNSTTINADVTSGDINFIVTGTVSAINNFTLNTVGPGSVKFQIITGDFNTDNNASVLNASIIAYAGSINFGNNTTVAGVLWAKNNITVNSGTIQIGQMPIAPAGDSKLSVTRWSGGSLSASTLVTSSLYAYTQRDSIAVSAPPLGAPILYVSRWREIGQDE